MPISRLWPGVVGIFFLFAWCNWVEAAIQPSPAGTAFFEQKIRPVLVGECFACHATGKEKKAKGGLALDSAEGLRQGGESGPLFKAGDPTGSLLLKALRHGDPELAMPPKKKLDEQVVRDFEAWIRMGAPDPRGAVKVTGPGAGKEHWAFQAPRRVVAPAVRDIGWARSEVDRFLLAALEGKGLAPVGNADRRTLLRRVTFDLTGLPPTPAEVEAFVSDGSGDAFAKVVDRLLGSSAFGEKWARHWLDVARYAESTGKTVNFNYPHAWRYRDYVIAAFNSDKPYDQFIREQLAGDLLQSDDPKVKAERVIATGFLAVGPKILNERNGLKFELDQADEQLDVTTQAFLGITAACARCHDHKFDPIPTRDYHALLGIFRSTETCYGTPRFINAQRPGRLIPLPEEAKPALAVERLSEAERGRIERQIETVQEAARNARDQVQRFLISGQVSLLQARLDAYDRDGNPKLLAMGVRDKPSGAGREGPGNRMAFAGFTQTGSRVISDSPVFMRGDADQPEAMKVPRGTLTVLAREPLKIPAGTSGRLELAGWIASKDNPLTARVMVNRVWMHLFGKGLVPTADDFGLAGRPPTHPELLDHLAIRFMEDGWSVKGLVRHLVLSRAYQLDCRAQAKAQEVDPDNTLLWRMAPRRLDAEDLRDAMLSVSGQLLAKPPTGSAVARAGEGPVSPPGLRGGQMQALLNDPRDTRRSVYLPVIRDNLPEAMALFDAADPTLITAERPRTTTPPQALYLMNSAFALRQADKAAERLLTAHGDEMERIRAAHQVFLCRAPTDAEAGWAKAFLTRYRERFSGEPEKEGREREAWSAYCQALFTSAEFQYRR